MAGISLFGVHDFDYLLRVVVYLLTLGTLTATSSTRRLNTMSLSLTSRLMNGPIASDYHHATEIEPRLTSAFLSSLNQLRSPSPPLPSNHSLPFSFSKIAISSQKLLCQDFEKLEKVRAKNHFSTRSLDFTVWKHFVNWVSIFSFYYYYIQLYTLKFKKKIKIYIYIRTEYFPFPNQ